MPVEIKTTNTKELLQKKQDRLSALRASTQLPSADIEEFEDLAHSGMLSLTERAWYDELRRVLILLGEDRIGCS